MGKIANQIIGVLAAGSLAVSGACRKDAASSTHEDKTTKAAKPEIAVPPPAPDARSKLDVLLSSKTLADAIEVSKADMTDTDDETSPGAIELATWAAGHLRWADVAVAKNETSFALVHKDSDSARGKRMCTRGTIIQIEKESMGSDAVFTGLLLSDYSDILSFIAAGSTGELVQNSGARFCGVVIGKYDYSNSGGGQGHAISLVGMFDLPENRKAQL